MSDDLVKRLRRVSMDLGIPSATTLDSKVVAHAADRIEALEAKLVKAVDALEECVEEIDAYIQHQYPHDHPVQERDRQQDYASNPARLALAELTGGKDD